MRRRSGLSAEIPRSQGALRLSVVVPVLDDATALRDRSDELRGLASAVHEVIIVDGGSIDGSVEIARMLTRKCFSTGPGRSRQMNEGARRSSGDVLVFLHADTRLPEGAPCRLAQALADSHALWGRFDVRLSGEHWMFRVIEWAMNWRSRLTGIATGDQAMFVRKGAFERAGGFPLIPLMEDVALSRRLRRLARPVCLCERVVTSSRRWQRDGILRTVLLMWCLRFAYALGVDPARLHRVYYRS